MTPLRPELVSVIGMDIWTGQCHAPLIKIEAEVFKTHAVEIKTLSVGTENSYELWGEVKDLLKFALASAQFFS
jgi:hypothetical protein